MDALIQRSVDAGERCVCAEPDRAGPPSSGAHPARYSDAGPERNAASGDAEDLPQKSHDESAERATPQELTPDPGRESGVVYLPWGVRSPLSARSLLTSVRNRFGSLERATLVAAPAASAASIVALSFSDIERYFDAEVRSIVFLTRELLLQLPENSGGGLTLVLIEPDGGVATPMQSLASGAVEGFYASVLEQYRESGPPVSGFVASGEEGDVDVLADFVHGQRTGHASRNRGRLQRFGKRTGLRSLFRQ